MRWAYVTDLMSRPDSTVTGASTVTRLESGILWKISVTIYSERDSSTKKLKIWRSHKPRSTIGVSPKKVVWHMKNSSPGKRDCLKRSYCNHETRREVFLLEKRGHVKYSQVKIQGNNKL